YAAATRPLCPEPITTTSRVSGIAAPPPSRGEVRPPSRGDVRPPHGRRDQVAHIRHPSQPPKISDQMSSFLRTGIAPIHSAATAAKPIRPRPVSEKVSPTRGAPHTIASTG